jgi:flagellar biosynthetic protein FliR
VVLSPAFTYGLLLLLIRTSALVVTSPLLGHRGIPALTKVGFSVVLALVLLPLEQENLPPPPDTSARLIEQVARETLFGLALGLAMNIVFVGLQMASHIVSLQMGFGLGQVIDPVSGAQSAVMDQFYVLLITLIFFVTNGHHTVIQVLAETVRAVPPGSFDPFTATSTGVPAVMAGLLVTAIRIAMPVMAALFLADLGLGFVARTVPQTNVLVVGMPIKLGIGMLVVAAALPVTATLVNGVLGSAMAGSSRQLLGVG